MIIPVLYTCWKSHTVICKSQHNTHRKKGTDMDVHVLEIAYRNMQIPTQHNTHRK